MAELQTRPAAPDKAESTKDAEDKKIAALRKTYDEVAKKVTDASRFADVPGAGVGSGYAELRDKKQAAFNALHAAEEAQSKRLKAEAEAQRGGRPPTP